MARVCLYHGGDLDGVCSAAIIKYAYPDTILHPIQYGDRNNIDSIVSPGDDVIMVDFVLQPFDHMRALSETTNLVWIDHHDTAISNYEEFLHCGAISPIKGLRDKSKSACELTWEYTYSNDSMPYSVWLLGRYDIWQHQESKSIVPFQYGMKLNYEPPEDMVFWKKIFDTQRDSEEIQTIIRQGKTIIKYRDKENKRICKIQAFDSNLMGYKCLCINRALCGASVFGDTKEIQKYDILVVFYICAKGAWNVSLYSTRPDVHVGNIAQLYGGGGHANAAGFRCTLLPFEISY